MLALIAGGGDLPRRVAAEQPEPPFVCALEGNQRPRGLDVDRWFRLETLGTLLLELGEAGITDICLCGSIDRPALDPATLDEETKPLVPLFMEALQKGDDGALRLVMQLFEQTGFAIRAAHELAPAIIAAPGIPTARQPRDTHGTDAELGRSVLAEMGAADLGQACVIRKGEVVAREDAAGTDAMLARLSLPVRGRPGEGDPLHWAFAPEGGLTPEAETWLRGVNDAAFDGPAAGAILYKGPKPGQDRRADLPTIGPATAMRAAEAGLDGIVIEAGGTIVLDQPQLVAILDAMRMFLWVRV